MDELCELTAPGCPEEGACGPKTEGGLPAPQRVLLGGHNGEVFLLSAHVNDDVPS